MHTSTRRSKQTYMHGSKGGAIQRRAQRNSFQNMRLQTQDAHYAACRDVNKYICSMHIISM